MRTLARIRRAWLRFLRNDLDLDIAILRDQVACMRSRLYDLEAKRHKLDLELSQAEPEAAP